MKQMKYVVKIPSERKVEDFQKTGDNVALFRIFDLEGNDVSDQYRHIIFLISGNAMRGLGKELIRLAHNFEEGKSVSIKPSTKNKVQQEMGMFLMPNSCELTIVCKDFDPVEKYLDKKSKNCTR